MTTMARIVNDTLEIQAETQATLARLGYPELQDKCLERPSGILPGIISDLEAVLAQARTIFERVNQIEELIYVGPENAPGQELT